jgi:iron complex transport system ATP-binding protein
MGSSIRLHALDLGYEGRPVLSGVSFDVAPGEFVGILGPNGSGKSTLLRAVAGLLPPQQGDILVQGEHIGRMDSRRRARLLAVVPQSTEVRFPFTCLEVVLMGRYPYRRRFGALSPDDLGLALEAMAHTTTAHLQERPINEVSGGEGQRVIVARALAQAPEILLLDEATSSLDVRKKLEIFEVLLELNRRQGLTVLCAMHDLNLAALYCRRLIFLKDGRVVKDGPTDTVFTPEVLAQVYDTPMEVARHPVHGRPYAVMLPLGPEAAAHLAAPEAARV